MRWLWSALTMFNKFELGLFWYFPINLCAESADGPKFDGCCYYYHFLFWSAILHDLWTLEISWGFSECWKYDDVLQRIWKEISHFSAVRVKYFNGPHILFFTDVWSSVFRALSCLGNLTLKINWTAWDPNESQFRRNFFCIMFENIIPTDPRFYSSDSEKIWSLNT